MEEWFESKVKSKPIVQMHEYCGLLKQYSSISNCP
jgi:hypothetical protein